MEQETMKCPYCGEEILAVAKKCKHCGEWLDEEEIEGEVEETEEKEETPKKVTIFTSRTSIMEEGEIVYLTSKLEGFDGYEIELQWQCDKGEGFEDVEGANADTYEFEANAETLSWGWKLLVTAR
jgi:hypothetical protein